MWLYSILTKSLIVFATSSKFCHGSSHICRPSCQEMIFKSLMPSNKYLTGDLKFFLGFEAPKSKMEIPIFHRKYTFNILSNVALLTNEPTKTMMAFSVKLQKNLCEPYPNNFLQRLAVGFYGCV